MRDQEKVLVEQTAKKYKLIQLTGLLVAIPACGGAVAAAYIDSTPLMAAAVAVALVGVVVTIVGGMLAWWHHG